MFITIKVQEGDSTLYYGKNRDDTPVFVTQGKVTDYGLVEQAVKDFLEKLKEVPPND